MQESSAILRPSCYQPVPQDAYILNRNVYFSVFQQAHQAKRHGHRCHLPCPYDPLLTHSHLNPPSLIFTIWSGIRAFSGEITITVDFLPPGDPAKSMKL